MNYDVGFSEGHPNYNKSWSQYFNYFWQKFVSGVPYLTPTYAGTLPIEEKLKVVHGITLSIIDADNQKMFKMVYYKVFLSFVFS